MQLREMEEGDCGDLYAKARLVRGSGAGQAYDDSEPDGDGEEELLYRDFRLQGIVRRAAKVGGSKRGQARLGWAGPD